MFSRRKPKNTPYKELCRATVKIPQTEVLQELGHHHEGPRRAARDRVQTHALVRLYDNGRHPVHGGYYYLITVGGDMDPYPTFTADGTVVAYRAFLLVQAVIAAGKMDAEARSSIPEALTARPDSSFVRWAVKTVGRERFLSIRNFPLAKMPGALQAIYRERTGGQRR